jgi:hypothetical protein
MGFQAVKAAACKFLIEKKELRTNKKSISSYGSRILRSLIFFCVHHSLLQSSKGN